MQPSVFRTHGTSAYAIGDLGWWLVIVAAAVVAIIGVLILIASFRKRGEWHGIERPGEEAARRWIVIGTGMTIAILLGTFIWTLLVMAGNTYDLHRTTMTVHVTGYKYWWKFAYQNDAGVVQTVTANELHIPVHTRVKLVLNAADVIHSFWVPDLSGKIDLIPGQTNYMWLEGDDVGEYYGQCAEYCGKGHANMRIRVFVDSTAAFQRWLAHDELPATPDTLGFRLFKEHACAACHTIRGTKAQGQSGPDLTHLASRQTLAAGILPNTREALALWLTGPDSLKPGTRMPFTDLPPADLRSIVTMLEDLK